MEKTQELAVEVLTRLGALKRGHFRLTSGLHSDCYMQCAVLFEHPKNIRWWCCREHSWRRIWLRADTIP